MNFYPAIVCYNENSNECEGTIEEDIIDGVKSLFFHPAVGRMFNADELNNLTNTMNTRKAQKLFEAAQSMNDTGELA